MSDSALTVFFQLGRQPSVTDFHSVVRVIGIGQSVTSAALSPGSWTMLVYSEETYGVEINIAFDISGILISTQMIERDLVSQHTKSCRQNSKTSITSNVLNSSCGNDHSGATRNKTG